MSFEPLAASPGTGITVQDVEAAWAGVRVLSPAKPPRLWITTACAVVFLLATALSRQPVLIWTAVALVIGAVLTDRRRNARNAATHSEAVRRADTDREHQVAALVRGYSFLGEHYRAWLQRGRQMIQEALPLRMGLSPLDPSALTVEPFAHFAIAGAPPTKPEIISTGAAAYPLPRKLPYTTYIVTPRSLVIVPRETCQISNINKGILAHIGAAITSIRDSPLAIDLEATSLACVVAPGAAPKIVWPEPLGSHELYFQEFVNVEYAKSEVAGTSAIVVTMRDGREIRVPGTEHIAELVRKNMERQKLHDAEPRESATVVEPRARESSAKSAEGFKSCPMCAEAVREAAKVCRFCGHKFEG